MSDKPRKTPLEETMGSLTKNLGRAAKVAGIAGRAIGREVKKSGVGRTIEDGGREVLRAGTHVATRLAGGLEKLGTRLDEAVTGSASASGKKEYPKSREEFEERYGEVDGDWPRSPEEFEKRFGFPPGDKPVGPTKKDPGFRIAKD